MKKLERVPPELAQTLAPLSLVALITAGRSIEDAHAEGLDASERSWAV